MCESQDHGKGHTHLNFGVINIRLVIKVKKSLLKEESVIKEEKRTQDATLYIPALGWFQRSNKIGEMWALKPVEA